MKQQLPPSCSPNQGPDTMDTFNQQAATHVQLMLNRLVADHQSIVQSLQSEITSLQQKHSDPDGKPAWTRVEEPCAPEIALDNINLQLASSDAGVHHVEKKEEQSCKQFDINVLPCEPESSKKPLESELDNALTHSQIQPSPHHTSKVSLSLSAMRVLVRSFVFSHSFEIITSGVIVANSIMMAMQQQYDGFDTGYAIRPNDYPKPKVETWPGGELTFAIADTVFNVLFSTELVLRFYANGFPSLRMPWMWFDSTVVVLGLMDSILSGGGLGIDPSMIRLVRLVRLVRLMKIFKSMSEFDSLFLLIKAIYASVHALVWSLLLLFGVMMGAALFLGQILNSEIMDPQKDIEERDELFMYFGTFSRTMMTMVEITLGNWVPACRLLIESVHESFFLFFLVYRCMFCFSVLRVINAVFISETNRVLASDVELTVMRGEREKHLYQNQLRQVLTSMDIDGSGTVSKTEVDKFLKDPQISRLLHTIGFSTEHVEKIFWVLAQDDQATIDDLVHRMLALRGNAKPVDLHCMDKQIEEIHRWMVAFEQKQHNCKQGWMDLQHVIERQIDQVHRWMIAFDQSNAKPCVAETGNEQGGLMSL